MDALERMTRAAEFQAKLIKAKIVADEERQKARGNEKAELNVMRSQMREKATKDKTKMLDLLASLKAKGNVQKSDLKLFGIDEAKFEGRGSEAISMGSKKMSNSDNGTTDMDKTELTFITAPTEATTKAVKSLKSEKKKKPVKALKEEVIPIMEEIPNGRDSI